MRLSFWADRRHRQEGLPKEIYISLVGSLYQDERTLFIGSIGVAAAAAITAVRTGEAWLLLCAVAMPVIGYLRVLDVRRFNRRRESIKTVEAARVWEFRYVAGSAATVLLIGAWCLATFIVSPDPFLRLLSFATTLAYLTGISGRNFSSPTLVHTQIIGAAIPLSLALMTAGTAYWLILGVVILPLLLSIKSISARLRPCSPTVSTPRSTTCRSAS